MLHSDDTCEDVLATRASIIGATRMNSRSLRSTSNTSSPGSTGEATTSRTFVSPATGAIFHKGPNIATQVDGCLVPLFHPRMHHWDEYFTVEGDRIGGVTAIGRGTVRLLNMNDDDRRELRILSGP